MTRQTHQSLPPPARLENGQLRCEHGAYLGGKLWCSRPATWILEGATIRSPGGVVCDEHRVRTKSKRAQYLPLENPPDAGSKP